MNIELDKDKKLRYVDTGKVKIGIYHVPRPEPNTFMDMEAIQRSLLPKALGPLHSIEWPTPRRIFRWLFS